MTESEGSSELDPPHETLGDLALRVLRRGRGAIEEMLGEAPALVIQLRVTKKGPFQVADSATLGWNVSNDETLADDPLDNHIFILDPRSLVLPIVKSDRNSEPDITVGRSENNDIQLGSARVSKLHASLRRGEDGGWLVQDRGSANGTVLAYVALSPGEEYSLSCGVVLKFADTRASFLTQDGLANLCELLS